MMNMEDKRKIEEAELEQVSGGAAGGSDTDNAKPKTIYIFDTVFLVAQKRHECPYCFTIDQDGDTYYPPQDYEGKRVEFIKCICGKPFADIV